MKTDLLYYDLYPRVVACGRPVALCVQPRDRHVRFVAGQPWFVHLIPMQESHPDFGAPRHTVLQVQPQAGALRFEAAFETEQQYSLMLCDNENYWACKRRISLQLYALKEDLLGLRPLRGCTHAHSFHSDGVESPEMVAACYRQAGYDFLAITDHERYAPSLEAMDFFQGAPIDLCLLPGEEVHPPGNPIHLVNFGGSFSVNERMKAQPEAYRRAVEEIAQGLDVPAGCHKAWIASCIWAFSKIREGGGIGILCHPNWSWQGAYNIPAADYDYFLNHVCFDALELFNGGNTPQENQLQLAAWYGADPARRPVVLAADDAHGCVNGAWFDIASTYVLAREATPEAIKAAIRQGLCCAAEHYPGQARRVHGPLRLVKYFAFLDSEVFPLHDALCQEEGRLMLALVAGEAGAGERLAALSGQTTQLYKRIMQG